MEVANFTFSLDKICKIKYNIDIYSLDRRDIMAEINKRKRPIAAILGFLIMLFTIIGLVTTVVGAVKLVKNLFDDSDRYVQYERAIYPVVMFDPVPFSSITAADPTMLLQSSMWAVLLNEDTTKYATDEIGFMLIPSLDLDVWCKKMFGDTVSLSHATIDSDMTSFYFDNETKMYHVPINASVVHYTPDVRAAVKNGEQTILTVDYLSPMSVATDIFKKDEAPTPDKTMYYVLDKTGVLVSVRFSPDDDSSDVVSEDESSEDVSSEVSSDEISSEDMSGEVSGEEVSSTDSSGETSSGDSSAETSSKDSSTETSSETSSK